MCVCVLFFCDIQLGEHEGVGTETVEYYESNQLSFSTDSFPSLFLSFFLLLLLLLVK